MSETSFSDLDGTWKEYQRIFDGNPSEDKPPQDSSLQLNLPSSDSSSDYSSSEEPQEGMQEKLQFSVLLMRTILDALNSIQKGKIRVQIRNSLNHWHRIVQLRPFESRIYALQTQRSLSNGIKSLAALLIRKGRKRVQSKFGRWARVLKFGKIARLFRQDADKQRVKYLNKLEVMNNLVDTLQSHQVGLEAKLSEAVQREQKYISAVRKLERGGKVQGRNRVQELVQENQKLKKVVASVESEVANYFEVLTKVVASHVTKKKRGKIYRNL